MKTTICGMFLSLMAASLSAQTQPASVSKQIASEYKPSVSKVVKFAKSIPARDMPVSALPIPYLHDDNDRDVEPNGLSQLHIVGPAIDGALQKLSGAPVGASVGLNMVGVGYPNYIQNLWSPPDPNAAIGDDASGQIVQWVNEAYSVFSKSDGHLIAGPIAGTTFWSGLQNSACNTHDNPDVIAQYDKTNRRWVMMRTTIFDRDANHAQTCIAVSENDNATGSYYEYAFRDSQVPDQADLDYPKLGIFPNGTNNAYFLTANYACFGSLGDPCTGLQGSAQYVCAYQSDAMIAGNPSPVSVCILDNDQKNGIQWDNSLLPADLDSSTRATDGEDEVLLGSINHSDNNLYLYKFHVDFNSPQNSMLYGRGGSMPISVASFNQACGGPYVACVPQPDPHPLGARGDRLMYRLAYRNFVFTGPKSPPDYEQWVVNHSVCVSNCPNGQVGIRWYELRDVSPDRGNPSIFQYGTFAPDSTEYRWMGSIASDKQGNLLLGYSRSSANPGDYPSIYYTGRLATDPLGTMEGELPIPPGGGESENGNAWG